AAEVALVDEQEVEERAHRGLAVREAHGIDELRGLVRGRDGAKVRLRSRVAEARVDRGLEAVLQVPDARRALTRERLRRSGEAVVVGLHEGDVVAFRDRAPR